jgi:hypothetical protein
MRYSAVESLRLKEPSSSGTKNPVSLVRLSRLAHESLHDKPGSGRFEIDTHATSQRRRNIDQRVKRKAEPAPSANR